MTDDKVKITLANGDTMEVHPDTPVRWAGGYAPFLAKYVKAGEACDAVYEPTREHWTPYEPWMRDVLADDARVSWIDGNECRCDWGWMRDEEDGDLAYMHLRVHPDDVPERPAEDDPNEALAEAEGRIADLECRAKKAEADLADMTRQRDEWKARHATLRGDVDEFQYKHREYPGTWELVDALARDTERGQS